MLYKVDKEQVDNIATAIIETANNNDIEITSFNINDMPDIIRQFKDNSANTDMRVIKFQAAGPSSGNYEEDASSCTLCTIQVISKQDSTLNKSYKYEALIYTQEDSDGEVVNYGFYPKDPLYIVAYIGDQVIIEFTEPSSLPTIPSYNYKYSSDEKAINTKNEIIDSGIISFEYKYV